MGVDIHAFVEKRTQTGWEEIIDYYGNRNIYSENPFHNRNTNLFAFLANVRNEEKRIPGLGAPRGIPKDVSRPTEEIDNHASYGDMIVTQPAWWFRDCHSCTWVTLHELLNFDYSKKFKYGEENCFNKELISLQELLPDSYFKELEKLKTFGDPKNIRLIICFDN